MIKKGKYYPCIDKVIDPEWNTASTADEDEKYYWIIRDKRKPDIKVVKKYKPSLCELVCKRTGWKAILIS